MMQEDEDIITIHLPKLTDEQYAEVLESVIAFMDRRWPDFAPSKFTN